MVEHTIAADREAEIVEPIRWCPIENPYACLGARCWMFGVCDHNRRLRKKTEGA